MADLKFDTNSLKTAAENYRTTASDMKTLRKTLKTDIADLKSKFWRSNAGDAFQDMYEDNWAENVDKYVAVMEELARLLDKAAADYEQIATKADILKVDSI